MKTYIIIITIYLFTNFSYLPQLFIIHKNSCIFHLKLKKYTIFLKTYLNNVPENVLRVNSVRISLL